MATISGAAEMEHEISEELIPALGCLDGSALQEFSCLSWASLSKKSPWYSAWISSGTVQHVIKCHNVSVEFIWFFFSFKNILKLYCTVFLRDFEVKFCNQDSRVTPGANLLTFNSGWFFFFNYFLFALCPLQYPCLPWNLIMLFPCPRVAIHLRICLLLFHFLFCLSFPFSAVLPALCCGWMGGCNSVKSLHKQLWWFWEHKKCKFLFNFAASSSSLLLWLVLPLWRAHVGFLHGWSCKIALQFVCMGERT